jgi:hypothetical protein
VRQMPQTVEDDDLNALRRRRHGCAQQVHVRRLSLQTAADRKDAHED